jgi:MFS family permease
MSTFEAGDVTLAVLSVAQFLIALDYSIVYVALPSIAADLHLTASLAPWVVSAYAVLFAGFLVVGGRLVDRLGARRLFVLAVLAFGAAGGAAGSGAVLLTARGAQGLAAALLQPAVLALVGTTFPAGPARVRAVAVWGSVGAAGLAAGVILGGLLTTASWRLTFTIGGHDVPPERQGTAGAVLTTSQYVSGALAVAVLTLVLGGAPGHGRFRAAFLLTATAAAAGLIPAGWPSRPAGTAGSPRDTRPRSRCRAGA